MQHHGMMKLAIVALAVVGSVHSYTVRAEAAPGAQWTEAQRQRGYALFRRSTAQPIDCRHLLPLSFVPGPDAIIEKKVGCELARGEAESLVVGIHALAEDVKNVRLQVECDLEVRVYRGVAGQVKKMLLEMPNNPGSWIIGAYLDESNVIAAVDQGRSQMFWLTVLAGPDAEPGVHRGRIRITSDHDGPAAELDLEVRVRPFVLQRARIAYAPFFYVEWGGGSALPAFAQTDEWIGRLYLDMVEHSHTSITFYGAGPSIDLTQTPPPPTRYTSSLLPLGKDVGLFTPDVPCISFVTNLGGLESEGGPSTAQKNRAMDWLEEDCRRQGWPELVTYGWDEPGYPARGDRHAAFREDHEALRNVRVRVGTAMAADAAYGYSDVLDVWIVYAGQITPEMCAEARRLGAEVWTYSCHLHAHQPLAGRYYAGLYMWVYGLKGHTTWHHYAQGHFKHIWMREGDTRPMPTVGWEARRDGVDDYRYLQMLEDSIAANPGDRAAAEARDWLKSLRQRLLGVDPHLATPGEPLAVPEYDLIRSRAADYIEKLGPVVAGNTDPGLPSAGPWPSGLKDEAKLFRGKPVRECMRGLEDDDPRVRRAAAWALYERGPEAAAATTMLAAQLDDSEVRMPALRALEAIGPAAFPAAAKIKGLLVHADAYIRLGATYALGAIAGAAPWLAEGETTAATELSPARMKVLAEALRVPFMDEKHWIAKVAGKALARMSAAAGPALPEAIELLDRPYNLYTWSSPDVVRKVIAAIGPEAGPAVPKLTEIVATKDGNARDEVLALAAIRRAAAAALPVLEKCAADETNPQRGAAYYALFSIREGAADLENMVDLLNTPGKGPAELARYLDALGAKASPAAALVPELLKREEFAECREALESFLRKVERGEGPTTLMP